MAPPKLDEERMKFDNEQFRVVSHTTKSNLKNVFDNIRDNANLTRSKKIDLNNLTREE